jgi:hypothetical protein
MRKKEAVVVDVAAKKRQKRYINKNTIPWWIIITSYETNSTYNSF